MVPAKLAVDGPAGSIVKVAEAELPDVAVIRADVAAETCDVVMVKFPLVWPSGIVMLPGTVAAALLLDRETCTPPRAAGKPSVTVPVALCPPETDNGAILRPVTAPVPAPTGLISSVAFSELAEFAVMVARTAAVIDDVETVNVPLDWP